MPRHSKIEQFNLQNETKERYESGDSFDSIADDYQARGFTISSTSIKRWCQSQPGYVPRSALSTPKTELNPVTAIPSDSPNPFQVAVPAFSSDEEKYKWEIDSLESLKRESLAAVLAGLKRHNSGAGKYPLEQLRGFKCVIDCVYTVCNFSGSGRRASSALDVNKALSPPERSELDEFIANLAIQ